MNINECKKKKNESDNHETHQKTRLDERKKMK